MRGRGGCKLSQSPVMVSVTEQEGGKKIRLQQTSPAWEVGSDRYGFFRHLQIQIICRFRFADISANADDLQIHAFIGRYGNISADLRGYLQIFEDI